MKKRDLSVPFVPQNQTVDMTVATLYRGDLSKLTEMQRSDLYNAAAFYIVRLKTHRAKTKPVRTHEEGAEGAATSPDEVAASSEETRSKKGKRR